MSDRCEDGRLMRAAPQRDDPYLEVDAGECPDCAGKGCASHGAEPAKGADAVAIAQRADEMSCRFCGRIVNMVTGAIRASPIKAEVTTTIDATGDDTNVVLASPVTTGEAELRKPDGYAYRYKTYFGDCIMFNGGEEYNLSKPIETIPYWLGTPPESANASLRAKLEEAERNGMEIAASLFDGFTWGPYKHPSIIIREAIAARQSAQAASQP